MRETEEQHDLREKYWSVASHMLPKQGSNLQPRHAPWLGIKPVAFWCKGQHSNQLNHTSQDSVIISSNRFLISCFLSFPSAPAMMQMMLHVMLSKGPLNYPHFLKFFFHFVALIGCFLLSCLPNHWFNFLLHPTYCLFLLVYSSFQILYSSFLTGSLWPFHTCYLFVEVFIKFLEHPHSNCFWTLYLVNCLHPFHEISCFFILGLFPCLPILAASLCLFLCIM